MRKAVFAPLVLFVVVLAAACSSGDGDQPPDPTVPRHAMAAPEKAGEYVNLPEIYRDERGLASYLGDDVPSTAPHMTVDVDYAGDGNSNPPTGGPHWSAQCSIDPGDGRRCGPAPWGVYLSPWPAETLVHNLEHGGTVIW